MERESCYQRIQRLHKIAFIDEFDAVDRRPIGIAFRRKASTTAGMRSSDGPCLLNGTLARGRVDPRGGISGEIGAQNHCVDEAPISGFKVPPVSTRQHVRRRRRAGGRSTR